MMMDDFITLANEHLSVEIDTGRGADILTLTHVPSGLDVLFSTPWRARADAVRSGLCAPSTTDAVSAWLEGYRGGWQTLCPNAGPPRSVESAPVGFHGEASLVRWDVQTAGFTTASLHTELFAVPLSIDRGLSLAEDRPALTIVDTLSNLSEEPIEFDYVSHPAFGGRFLDGDCRIDSGATRFTTDPDTSGNVSAPNTAHEWPWVIAEDGSKVDLRVVPPPGERRMAFGWLSDFTEHWAAITNVDLGLSVRLDWDGTYLPYAWFWQELNHSRKYPWFRRARVVAIEASSTQTSGPERRSVLVLGANESIRIEMTVSLNESDGQR